MQQVFISYSRKEEKQVLGFADALRDANIPIWLDVRNIATGENWRDAIQRGLDSCTMMLLIITPNSMESEQVSNEWQYFLDEGKPIIPVLLEPAKVHFQLRSLNYVDFHQREFDIAFQMLLKAISEKADADTLSREEVLVLDMLRSAYKNWLNFDRADDLLLDKRQTARVLDTMFSYPLTESLWRYLLSSVANSQHPLEADSALIHALREVSMDEQVMIIDPLLVHPTAKIRQNITRIINLAQLKTCVPALQQCLPNETDEQTIVLMITALHDLGIDLPQSTLTETFERLTQWYLRSQLLNLFREDTKNVLFITDETDLAHDFRLMCSELGFNIVDVSPQDMLLMPYTMRQVDADIFKPYHLVFIIKGEHVSTINYERFYDSLANYVRSGGTLFATSWMAWESQNNTTLASILPFQYQKFKENVTLTCVPTEEGLSEGIFTEVFSIITSFEHLLVYDDTHVLLEDSDKHPLFGYRYVGEGRTFYLNSCQHSCTDYFEAQTRTSSRFALALERVCKWIYESV